MDGTGETEALRAGVPAAEARVLCVVIHGRYGAPEVMMNELVCRLSAPGVHYVLPRAAGEGWYDARSFDPLTELTRQQIEDGLRQVERDIAAAVATGAPADRLVVGGFSQGACMTLEFAGRHGPWSGAACALTGFRVGALGEERPCADLTDMPIYLSTGARDPFITLSEFAETVFQLADAGARVRSDVFPREAHVMSPTEAETFDAVLRAVAEGRPPLAASAA